jgi:hypothetical protein
MLEQVIIYLLIGTVAIFAINFLCKMSGCIADFVKDKIYEYKLRKQAINYIKKKIKEDKESYSDRFFGLFEIELSGYGDLPSIQQNYYSIIKEKLEPKYKNLDIQPNPKDKMFFVCKDFLKLESVVKDFVDFYQNFHQISEEKQIQTALKFSLWSQAGQISNKQALKTLSEMNSLHFVNKVISNDELRRQYGQQKTKSLDFSPYGVMKLIENDEEIDLYRITFKK